MGEAKRKAKQAKKRGQGLVISTPVLSQGGHLLFKSGFDPARLRFWALFFDKLAYPQTGLIEYSNTEMEFLESESVLIKPHVFPKRSGYYEELHVQSHIAAFRELEKNEPTAWAMDQGDHSIDFGDQLNFDKSSIKLELINAIPIPDKDVPLQDVLEFRVKRIDQLRRLQRQIAELYEAIDNSRDPMHALSLRVEEIEDACAELLNAAKMSKLRWLVGTLKPTFNVSLAAVAGTNIGALADAALAWGMPQVSAAVGATAATLAASGINLSLQPGGVDIKPRNSPYVYVASYHKELFIV